MSKEVHSKHHTHVVVKPRQKDKALKNLKKILEIVNYPISNRQFFHKSNQQYCHLMK